MYQFTYYDRHMYVLVHTYYWYNMLTYVTTSNKKYCNIAQINVGIGIKLAFSYVIQKINVRKIKMHIDL